MMSKQSCFKIRHFFIMASTMMAIVPNIAWADWYRYYDASGKPTVSTNVTANHIKYGYEVLNKQMQVIRRVEPSNQAIEKRQLQQAQANRNQQQELQRLRTAYGSSSSALRKRDEVLKKMNDQLTFYNTQYNQLLSTNRNLQSQQSNYTRQGQAVPVSIAQALTKNTQALHNISNNIRVLQQQINKTSTEYQQVIQTLKTNGY